MKKLYVFLAFPLECMLHELCLQVRKLTPEEASAMVCGTKKIFSDEESADMIGLVFHHYVMAAKEAMHPEPGVYFLVGDFTGVHDAVEGSGAHPEDFEWYLFEVHA